MVSLVQHDLHQYIQHNYNIIIYLFIIKLIYYMCIWLI